MIQTMTMLSSPITWFLPPIKPDQQTRTIILTLIMIAVGTVAGTGLSVFTAYLNMQRQKPTA